MTSFDNVARPLLTGYLSDNAAGASPEILAAVTAAAQGLAAPYGNDELSEGVTATLSEVSCPRTQWSRTEDRESCKHREVEARL